MDCVIYRWRHTRVYWKDWSPPGNYPTCFYLKCNSYSGRRYPIFRYLRRMDPGKARSFEINRKIALTAFERHCWGNWPFLLHYGGLSQSFYSCISPHLKIGSHSFSLGVVFSVSAGFLELLTFLFVFAPSLRILLVVCPCFCSDLRSTYFLDSCFIIYEINY